MRTSIKALLASSVLAVATLASSPAFADDTAPPSDFTVSGNVALVTDYRFRGVSLSGGDPAIQGGITVSHSSGFYVGTWSSSIRGGDVYGEQELDLFGGWTGQVTSGLSLDAGLLVYVYPGSQTGNADYWEPYASISGTVGPATAKVGVAYAWSQSSLGDQDNTYVYGNLDVGVPNTPITVSGHVGYTDGVLSPYILAGGTKRNGWDYSIGASAAVWGPLSLGVSYIGVDGPSVNGLTDDAVVGTLTASF
ncbi:TorF family putative porin [Novosphingobium sp. ZN18A2]|uniref:TorF family putative porin n=1 Tax=Novosphingobium sp. ZN18A2 TaxID=3079861 RepID=UPI0030CEE98B